MVTSCNSVYGILVAQTVKNLPAMQETQARSLGQEDPLEKEMATHSSILSWRTPWTEEPGKVQSLSLQSVGHHWATNTFTPSHAPPESRILPSLCQQELPQLLWAYRWCQSAMVSLQQQWGNSVRLIYLYVLSPAQGPGILASRLHPPGVCT